LFGTLFGISLHDDNDALGELAVVLTSLSIHCWDSEVVVTERCSLLKLQGMCFAYTA